LTENIKVMFVLHMRRESYVLAMASDPFHLTSLNMGGVVISEHRKYKKIIEFVWLPHRSNLIVLLIVINRPSKLRGAIGKFPDCACKKKKKK
jgi:hypothetical protein